MSSVKVLLDSAGWWVNEDCTLYYWSSIGSAPGTALLDAPVVSDNLARDLTGQWSVIDLRSEFPVIVADLARSHTLLYAKDDSGGWIISDSVRLLADAIVLAPDQEARKIFVEFGYTLGSRTLFAGVNQVRPGTTVTLTSGEAQVARYYEYVFTNKRVSDRVKFAQMFDSVLNDCFQELITEANGAQIVVPISGGLDSRLILSYLKSLDAQNVLTFSYGTPNSEAKQAQKVAESLGFDFFFCEYEPNEIRDAWAQDSAEEFRVFASNATSLPHIQDWFALLQLEEHNLIQPGAIFLPGHTIVGNMHDEELAEVEASVSASQLTRVLAKQHGSLTGRQSAVRRSNYFQETARVALAEVNFDGTGQSVQAAIEWFNLAERQAKYINNSMRNYEFFGYRWALPMLDVRLWSIWLQGSPQFTLRRDWYADFVAEKYQSVEGGLVDLYDPRTAAMKKAVASKPVQLIAKTPLGALLNNARTAVIQVQHPLAFEAFDPPRSNLKRAVRRLRGVSQVGEWTKQFITGSWGRVTSRM